MEVFNRSVFENHEPYLRMGQLSINKLVFGLGVYTTIGNEIKQLIGKNEVKTLLVTDKGIEKAGLVDKITNILTESKIVTETFNEVEPEPTFRCLQKVTEIVRNENFDAIIGLGGGSSMDVAKTASAMATNPGNVNDYFQFIEDKIKIKPLLKIMVPTTSGTGSEVSFGAVAIDNEGYKTFINNPLLQSELSIVDPIMTTTCPPRLTAACGMDALAHLMEAYINLYSMPLADTFALHGIKLVMDNLITAVHHGGNLNARYNMAIASTLGGLCINLVTNNIGHCISEAIGPMYNIPHGIANTIVLPYQMRYNLPVTMDRLSLLTHYLDDTDTTKLSRRESALRCISIIRDLAQDMELPVSLKEVNIPKKDIPKIADRIMKLYDPYDLSRLNPKKPTIENVKDLLSNMWEGTI